MRIQSKCVWSWLAQLIAVIGLAVSFPPSADAQERRLKMRISNAGFTMTTLPLLAAKDWGVFAANGLDMELILMQSALVPAALTQGDIDYQAGVGPASVNATLAGFATRAIWFSSDKISYWLMAKPQFKTLESLKAKKVSITGLGGAGRFQFAFNMALEKLGVSPKDFVLVSIGGQQIQQFLALESGYVDAALLSPPVTFGAEKKGFYKVLDVGAMVEMPGGGLTALVQTIQERPADTKRVIRSLQLAKDEIRRSKPKTLELIVRLLKMDKEAASKFYDQFLTTLSQTVYAHPHRHGDSGQIGSIPRPPCRSQSRFHRHRRRWPRDGSRKRIGVQDSVIRRRAHRSGILTLALGDYVANA